MIGTALKMGMAHLVFALLFILVAIGLLYLAAAYLLAYSAAYTARQAAERQALQQMSQTDPIIFEGYLWHVKIDGDEIESVTKFLYTSRYCGKLSEVKRLKIFHRQYRTSIGLLSHDYKWDRRDKEIFIDVSNLRAPVIQEMMNVIKTRAVNAQASPEYMDAMENGKGLS